MKTVIVLGATGSVGGSVLAVVRDHPDAFRVVGLVAGRGGEKLAALAREFPDAAVALGRGTDSGLFAGAISESGRRGRFYAEPDGALRLLAEVEADICVAAVAGTAGLELAFAAAARGMRILLANKEVLVSAGRLFMDAARAGGARVLPLDSEHTALWQCLENHPTEEVEKLIITASGGPFREWPVERMAEATPADALAHPVWRMGAKISVDSATLANKALELMEAHQLFGFAWDAMEIVVHRQSAVHGLIEFVDGSILAHLGICDMRQPIAYMLFYPHRRPNRLPRMDLVALGRLDFEAPDVDRFPLLRLGLEAGRRGGKYPACYNAANEAAVELFLQNRLPFPGIADAVARAMAGCDRGDFSRLDQVFAVHEQARRAVLEFAGRA
ncbi:MAG: 1-deoxy-D-xylulose-5-phosphate reductoisomerase [Planctomycetes bacterium]|nr:1-deoxy-D-xylulose-5-phosphate reductoisomerase [Planctomycetota bacterium]